MLKFAVTGRPDRLTSFVEEQANRKRKASVQSSASFSSSSLKDFSVSGTPKTLERDQVSFRYEDSFSMRGMEKNLPDSNDDLFDLEESMTFEQPKDPFDRSDLWRKHVKGCKKSVENQEGAWNRLHGNMKSINAILPQRTHSVSSSFLPLRDGLQATSRGNGFSDKLKLSQCASCQNLKSVVVDNLIESCNVLSIEKENKNSKNVIDNGPKCKRPRLGSMTTNSQGDANPAKSNSTCNLPKSAMNSKKVSHLKNLYNKLFGKKKNRTTPKFHKNMHETTGIFGTTFPDCTIWELNSSRDTVFNLLKEDVSL